MKYCCGGLRLARSSGEVRLLETFASQGGLALERARLAQAESRALVLEESDHLKSILLSSVSHELRTPLSTIKAAASSLRGNEVSWDSPARAELIAAIDDEADHLNMLVGNLLDMSRIESGALKPKREWNILSEIVGSVLGRMRHSAEEHKLEIDVPENLPFVPVDFVQMEQVFTNLVSNSLKYAPADTVIHIRANVRAIQFMCRSATRDRKCRPKIWNAFSTSSIASPPRIGSRAPGLGFRYAKGLSKRMAGAFGPRIFRMDWPSISRCLSPGRAPRLRRFRWIPRPNEQPTAYPCD